MTRLNKHAQPIRAQSGFALLEALIAILIFSFGILAIMGLQAVAISDVRDAKYRSDATFLADQIIGQMWTDWANLDDYALNTGGSNCSFSGGSSASGTTASNISGWESQVSALLPQSATAQHQISVNTATNTVTVTICWKAAQDADYRRHSVTAQIQGPNA